MMHSALAVVASTSFTCCGSGHIHVDYQRLIRCDLSKSLAGLLDVHGCLSVIPD